MTYAQRFSAVAFIFLLPSCTTVGPVGVDVANFGEAEVRNVAAQTVNPNAPTDSGPIDTNGERAELAQRRYVTGAVIEPADISPSAGIQTGGTGGGGGGAGAAMGAGGTGAGGAGGR